MDVKDPIFGDLGEDDDLAAVIDAPKGDLRQSSNPSYTQPTFTESCSKCHGSGRTPWGPCFKCKGAGKKSFKTSPAQRAGARAARVHVKVSKAAEQRAWREAHTVELEWLNRVANREETKMGVPPFKYWEFPVNLRNSLSEYGSLTEGQLGAIRKCMAKEAERAVERKTAEANATEIDISKIEAAFATYLSNAARDGDRARWVNLDIDGYRFSYAPAKAQWPDSIFIKVGETNLGRCIVGGGRFIRSRACTDEQAARIVEIAADPAKAAQAHGLRYKYCACCGLELTNEESRKLGIGPICRDKWGF